MSDKNDDKINFKLNFKKETQKKIDDFRRIVKYFVILIIGFLIIKYISVKCSPILFSNWFWYPIKTITGFNLYQVSTFNQVINDKNKNIILKKGSGIDNILSTNSDTNESIINFIKKLLTKKSIDNKNNIQYYINIKNNNDLYENFSNNIEETIIKKYDEEDLENIFNNIKKNYKEIHQKLENEKNEYVDSDSNNGSQNTLKKLDILNYSYACIKSIFQYPRVEIDDKNNVNSSNIKNEINREKKIENVPYYEYYDLKVTNIDKELWEKDPRNKKKIYIYNFFDKVFKNSDEENEKYILSQLKVSSDNSNGKNISIGFQNFFIRLWCNIKLLSKKLVEILKNAHIFLLGGLQIFATNTAMVTHLISSLLFGVLLPWYNYSSTTNLMSTYVDKNEQFRNPVEVIFKDKTVQPSLKFCYNVKSLKDILSTIGLDTNIYRSTYLMTDLYKFEKIKVTENDIKELNDKFKNITNLKNLKDLDVKYKEYKKEYFKHSNIFLFGHIINWFNHLFGKNITEKAIDKNIKKEDEQTLDLGYAYLKQVYKKKDDVMKEIEVLQKFMESNSGSNNVKKSINKNKLNELQKEKNKLENPFNSINYNDLQNISGFSAWWNYVKKYAFEITIYGLVIYGIFKTSKWGGSIKILLFLLFMIGYTLFLLIKSYQNNIMQSTMGFFDSWNFMCGILNKNGNKKDNINCSENYKNDYKRVVDNIIKYQKELNEKYDVLGLGKIMDTGLQEKKTLADKFVKKYIDKPENKSNEILLDDLKSKNNEIKQYESIDNLNISDNLDTELNKYGLSMKKFNALKFNKRSILDYYIKIKGKDARYNEFSKEITKMNKNKTDNSKKKNSYKILFKNYKLSENDFDKNIFSELFLKNKLPGIRNKNIKDYKEFKNFNNKTYEELNNLFQQNKLEDFKNKLNNDYLNKNERDKILKLIDEKDNNKEKMKNLLELLKYKKFKKELKKDKLNHS